MSKSQIFKVQLFSDCEIESLFKNIQRAAKQKPELHKRLEATIQIGKIVFYKNKFEMSA